MAGLEDLDLQLMKVAVVGAGWAGLSAAVEMAHRGAQVTVFEAARQSGGRARRVCHEGIDLDNGQHVLLGAYRETLRLLTTVGIDLEKAFARLPLTLHFPDLFELSTFSSLPAPLHLLAGLLAAHGFDRREKVAAIRFMLAMRFRGFRVAPDMEVGKLLALHRQPRKVVRFLWAPLCIAALNTPAEIASAQVFLNVMRDAFTQSRKDSDLLLPRVDLSALFPDPAEAFIKARGGLVNCGTAVSAIYAAPTGWVVGSQGLEDTFQSVVCAVPPYVAARLLETAAPQIARAMAVFQYEPIVTCYLQYSDSASLPRPMIGLAGELGQWALDREQLGGPTGLIAVVISAAAHARELDHATLARKIDAELREQVGRMPQLRWQRVITEKRATFRCTPGLARPSVDSGLRGLYLAGDHVENGYPATLEGAVRSGLAAGRAATSRAG